MTNVHYLSPTGPTNQATVGPNRLVYDSDAVFSSIGPFRQTVYASIIDDEIGLEDDEIVHLVLIINSPSPHVTFSHFSTTVVKIVDDDCKPSLVRESCFEMYVVICFDLVT